MKHALLAVLVLGVAGCASEPNWRNVGSAVSDWRIPPDEYEHVVSRPLKYEELPDHVQNMMGAGWEVISTESAGPEFPAQYLVVCRRFR